MMHGLTDMAKEEGDAQASPLMPQDNKYPYGLRITLTHEELEKLDVDHTDWEMGETFHIHALAKVVSKSANEREGGEASCSVELQLTHLAGESEDAENKEEEHEDGPDLKPHGYLRYK